MGCFKKFSRESIKKSDETNMQFIGDCYVKGSIEELRGLLFQKVFRELRQYM